jgi:hypothetical protein
MMHTPQASQASGCNVSVIIRTPKSWSAPPARTARPASQPAYRPPPSIRAVDAVSATVAPAAIAG